MEVFMLYKEILNFTEEKSKEICNLSDQIWDNPETGYSEQFAVSAMIKVLEKEGFKITRNLADIPTAFSAKYGNSGPVIGILGEFDALPAMNQEANAAVKKTDSPDCPGHGCGHNLLGAGSIWSAIATKKYLEDKDIEGTIIYLGCPAEEGGSGKAFMARAGVFDNLDCALSWHPNEYNSVWAFSSLANVQVKYHFHGRSSHAAVSPHLGRSALDAVEVMNIGCQYLREHIIPEARVHYAITNTGGTAQAGFINAIITFTKKLCSSVFTLIVGTSLAAAGYIAGSAMTPEIIDAILNIKIYTPFALMILTLIILRIYPITPAYGREMRAKLQEIRAAK